MNQLRLFAFLSLLYEQSLKYQMRILYCVTRQLCFVSCNADFAFGY